MSKPRGDDDGGRRSLFTRSGDDIRHGLRGRRDHEQIGRLQEILNGSDRSNALDLVVMRINEADCSLETADSKVSQYGTAWRCFAPARTHDCDRPRRKQLVETIGRHPRTVLSIKHKSGS